MSQALIDYCQARGLTGEDFLALVAAARTVVDDPVLSGDLRVLCLAESSTLVPGNRDLTAFQEGRRSVWLHLSELAGLNDNAAERLAAAIQSPGGSDNLLDGGL